MSKLETVSISHIRDNPHRDTELYVYNPRKIAGLKRSMNAIGFFEGVIARNRNGNYELAFGHHRCEAARQLRKDNIPIIVKNLNDEEMLRYMILENSEEFNDDAYVALYTWEATKLHLESSAKKSEPIDIAMFLGWTRHDAKGKSQVRPDHKAAACANSFQLIDGGYMKRNQFMDANLNQIEPLASRACSLMDQIDKSRIDAKDKKKGKAIVAKAANIVLDKAKAGAIGYSDIRSELDTTAHRISGKAKGKKTPLFRVFAKALTRSLERCLVEDSLGDRLNACYDNLEYIEAREDIDAVNHVRTQLSELAGRAQNWAQDFKHHIPGKAVKAAEPKLLEGK